MENTYSAFQSSKLLAHGDLQEVALSAFRALQTDPATPVFVLDDASGQVRDLDLRGPENAVIARYGEAGVPKAAQGRGRPRLGVVAREVTLLPEHWEWLASQPGGASVALRKLVHEARRNGGEQERKRAARDRAYRAMSALAGDFVGFEAASRALFAGDVDGLATLMAVWPSDVRDYVLQLLNAGSS